MAELPTHWMSSIHSWRPVVFGMIMLFLGVISYLTDCYSQYGTSTLAATTMLRALSGAVFPCLRTRPWRSHGR